MNTDIVCAKAAISNATPLCWFISANWITQACLQIH